MIHSDSSNNANFDEVDEEMLGIDMDSIPDVEDIDGMDTTDEDRIAIRDALDKEKKTDQEIQIDQMEQLLASKRCNTWERGFCDSCLRFLKSKRDAQLSYKQKDVLAKTWAKYSMD